MLAMRQASTKTPTAVNKKKSLVDADRATAVLHQALDRLSRAKNYYDIDG
jgi:hypothetical protein